jgi:hypothetical protein
MHVLGIFDICPNGVAYHGIIQCREFSLLISSVVKCFNHECSLFTPLYLQLYFINAHTLRHLEIRFRNEIITILSFLLLEFLFKKIPSSKKFMHNYLQSHV